MKTIIGLLLAACVASVVALADGMALSTVRHRWQEVITESNHAALRPGSVYDILTHFEQRFGFRRPTFKYMFFDTGLGAADPIYPVFQVGHQQNWSQLIKAGLSDQNRHIDHFSIGETPEGCRIQSVYWVRHIDEFPDMYADLRAAGYSLIDISFDYYSKLRPDAQCGKHIAHDVGDQFDPFASIYGYAQTFKTLADIPPDLLGRYEAKVGVLKLVSERFKQRQDNWASFDQEFAAGTNSMWFYPGRFAPDHGVRSPSGQSGLKHPIQPRHLFIAAEPLLSDQLTLAATLPPDDFSKVVSFVKGKPVPDFDPRAEPGSDTLDITTQVTTKNFYTSGTTVEPIGDVVNDIADPRHYALVSAIIRPAEPEHDIHFDSLVDIPQLRLIYQLVSPRFPGRAYEQMFVHLNFDAIDRLLPVAQRSAAAADFLMLVDRLTKLRESNAPDAGAATAEFLKKIIQERPAQTVSWSSSLTGIWVFGMLSRSYNLARHLDAVPIEREGINVGFYSSAYDTPIFRKRIDQAADSEKTRLQALLDDLTPASYRDERRHDAKALTFNRLTCAQCHQMAGRDGIHVQLNDHLDRRITTSYRATEYLFRELEQQLQRLPSSKARTELD